jgi:CHAT domain-containing protein
VCSNTSLRAWTTASSSASSLNTRAIFTEASMLIGFFPLRMRCKYAGARALLVSHWEVGSDAAVKLTTRAFAELNANPKIGRAEAFRISMREMIEKSSPAEAHPASWAPFVVVGEGAAAR